MKFLINREFIEEINEAVIGSEPTNIQKRSFEWVYGQIYGDQRPTEFKIPKLAHIHKWILEIFGLTMFVYKSGRRNTYSILKVATYQEDDYSIVEEEHKPKLVKETQGKPNEIVYKLIRELVGNIVYNKLFETKYLRVENLKQTYHEDVNYWKTSSELIDSNKVRSTMNSYFIRNQNSNRHDKYYFSINDENLFEIYLPYKDYGKSNKNTLKLVGIKKLNTEQSTRLKNHLETAQEENEYYPELFTDKKKYRRIIY